MKYYGFEGIWHKYRERHFKIVRCLGNFEISSNTLKKPCSYFIIIIVIIIIIIIIIYFQWSLRNSNSGNLSAMLFENQNKTAVVAMEMKYQHEGISYWAEIALVLTNHLLEIS